VCLLACLSATREFVDSFCLTSFSPYPKPFFALNTESVRTYPPLSTHFRQEDFFVLKLQMETSQPILAYLTSNPTTLFNCGGCLHAKDLCTCRPGEPKHCTCIVMWRAKVRKVVLGSCALRREKGHCSTGDPPPVFESDKVTHSSMPDMIFKAEMRGGFLW